MVTATGWGPVVGDGEGLTNRLRDLVRDGYRVIVAADGEGSAQRMSELLLERGPLTRAQLGELTGLSKVTASQLVERLEERQLVSRVGELAGGRRPVPARAPGRHTPCNRVLWSLPRDRAPREGTTGHVPGAHGRGRPGSWRSRLTGAPAPCHERPAPPREP